jgi:hypothetical protein
MDVIDQLIDRRRRWHEADPERAPSRWLSAFRAGAWLLAVAALVERLAG